MIDFDVVANYCSAAVVAHQSLSPPGLCLGSYCLGKMIDLGRPASPGGRLVQAVPVGVRGGRLTFLQNWTPEPVHGVQSLTKLTYLKAVHQAHLWRMKALRDYPPSRCHLWSEAGDVAWQAEQAVKSFRGVEVPRLHVEIRESQKGPRLKVVVGRRILLCRCLHLAESAELQRIA